jgi:hypothetical protein
MGFWSKDLAGWLVLGNAVIGGTTVGIVAANEGLRKRLLKFHVNGVTTNTKEWPADTVAINLAAAPFVWYLVYWAVHAWKSRKGGAVNEERASMAREALAFVSNLFTDVAVYSVAAHVSGASDMATFILVVGLAASSSVMINSLGNGQREGIALYLIAALIVFTPAVILLVHGVEGPIDYSKDDAELYPIGFGLGVSLSVARNIFLLYGRFYNAKGDAESREDGDLNQNGRWSDAYTTLSFVSSLVFIAAFISLAITVPLGLTEQGSDTLERTWARVHWWSNGMLEKSERFPILVMALVAAAAYTLTNYSGIDLLLKCCSKDKDNFISRLSNGEWLGRFGRRGHSIAPVLDGIGDAAVFLVVATAAGATDLTLLVAGAGILLSTNVVFGHFDGFTAPLFAFVVFLINQAPYACVLAALLVDSPESKNSKVVIWYQWAAHLLKGIVAVVLGKALLHGKGGAPDEASGFWVLVLHVIRSLLDAASVVVVYTLGVAGGIFTDKESA